MDVRIFTEPQQGASYDQLVAFARRGEELGYDAFFRSDHFLRMGDASGLPGPTDAWLTLGGIARETSRIRLGTLVTSATFRFPGLLAVQVAQVDAMSNGRVELGLGAGWYDDEHRAYGVPFAPLGERFERLEEQLAIVTGLWSTPDGDTFSFNGRHYELADSPALPKPVQQPIPVVMGGYGTTRTPRLAAKYAHEFNLPFPPLDYFGTACDIVRAACEKIERDPQTMVWSVALVVCCGENEADIARRAKHIGREVGELRANGAAGTPAEVAEKVRAYAAAGAQRVYLQFLDVDDHDHLAVVAEHVVPHLTDLPRSELMDVQFGVHTGLQHTSIPELQDLWRRIEALGFDWISIWDHFYAADATGNPHCLEAVASHAALAATTSRVRCGSLVYSVGYRHPAVLANAMATLDQLSNGRITLGLGGGWLQNEYDVYGIEYGTPGERLKKLEESIQCVRGLLTQDTTDFDGRYFTLRGAQCEPKPVQARLPIWIGGGGEKVTLRIAAQYADGWNVPFIPPDQWAHKAKVLDEHCERVGRDPKEITKTVNVGMAFTDEELRQQFGAMADYIRPSVFTGSVQQMVDHAAAFCSVGASTLILAMRAPFDRDGLERFAAEVMPAINAS